MVKNIHSKFLLFFTFFILPPCQIWIFTIKQQKRKSTQELVKFYIITAIFFNSQIESQITTSEDLTCFAIY